MDHVNQNKWESIRFVDNAPSHIDEVIAAEFPLTVVLNGDEFATIVCSPTDLHELLVGFLASEGVIRFMDEINSIQIDEGQGFAYIELNKSIDLSQSDHSKRFIGSCCGKSRQFYFKNDVKTAKTITSHLTVTVDQCYDLMKQMHSQSKQFFKTGGVHNAALCTAVDMLTIKTDIGRHNALDKIYGSILEEHVSLSDKLIVFSGRISSEVVLKVSKIGVGILISKSAPTDLALKLAVDLGITVAGFVRGNKMNVYTHTYRIRELNNI